MEDLTNAFAKEALVSTLFLFPCFVGEGEVIFMLIN